MNIMEINMNLTRCILVSYKDMFLNEKQQTKTEISKKNQTNKYWACVCSL